MSFRQTLINSFFDLVEEKTGRCRADGPHMGGVIGPARLFGGHIVAQSYLVAKKINTSGKVISSVGYNFISAGKPTLPITYEAQILKNLIFIKTYHEDKNIGHCHLKLTEDFLPGPAFPENIPPLNEVLRWQDQVWPDTWVSGLGQEGLQEQYAYEFRPVEFIHHHNIDNSVKYYSRLHPSYLVPQDGGMVVATALSDMFIIQPAVNALERKGFMIETGASLHHRIYFHTDFVEASQWFFVYFKLELMENMKPKIIGHIYDSNKKSVLTTIQEAYCVHLDPPSKI